MADKEEREECPCCDGTGEICGTCGEPEDHCTCENFFDDVLCPDCNGEGYVEA